MRRSGRHRRARAAERKAWLEQAAQWDGVALAWHPGLRRVINMDWYKETGAEKIMARLDALPKQAREAVYNSPDGNIDHTLERLRGR